MKKRAIIGFLTDFGYQDPYVGICKAIMAAINPDIKIVDITHMVRPQDILQAAVYLKASLPAFPDNAIVLAIVDPGVGSDRAPIVIRHGGRYLIGPDNGIFGLVLKGEYQAYRIRQKPLHGFLKLHGVSIQTSNTFHARDIFSPAAALISKGILPEDFCSIFKKPVKDLDFPKAKIKNGVIEGHLLYFDGFGNACTSITSKDLSNLKCDTSNIKVTLHTKNGKRLSIPFGRTFSSVPPGRPICYINSFDLVEVAVNMDSAQKILGLSIGDKIILYCQK